MSEFMMQKYLEINNWIESLKREEGQTLTEYALLLVLIAIVVVVAVAALGDADQRHLRQTSHSSTQWRSGARPEEVGAAASGCVAHLLRGRVNYLQPET